MAYGGINTRQPCRSAAGWQVIMRVQIARDIQRGSASDRQVGWFCLHGTDRGIMLRPWMRVRRVMKVTVLGGRPGREW